MATVDIKYLNPSASQEPSTLTFPLAQDKEYVMEAAKAAGEPGAPLSVFKLKITGLEGGPKEFDASWMDLDPNKFPSFRDGDTLDRIVILDPATNTTLRQKNFYANDGTEAGLFPPQMPAPADDDTSAESEPLAAVETELDVDEAELDLPELEFESDAPPISFPPPVPVATPEVEEVAVDLPAVAATAEFGVDETLLVVDDIFTLDIQTAIGDLKNDSSTYFSQLFTEGASGAPGQKYIEISGKAPDTGRVLIPVNEPLDDTGKLNDNNFSTALGERQLIVHSILLDRGGFDPKPFNAQSDTFVMRTPGDGKVSGDDKEYVGFTTKDDVFKAFKTLAEGTPLPDVEIEGVFGTLKVSPDTGGYTYKLDPFKEGATSGDTTDLTQAGKFVQQLGHNEYVYDVFSYRSVNASAEVSAGENVLDQDSLLDVVKGQIAIQILGANEAPIAVEDTNSITASSIGGTFKSAPSVGIIDAKDGLLRNDSDREMTPNPAFGGKNVQDPDIFDGKFEFVVFAESSPPKLSYSNGAGSDELYPDGAPGSATSGKTLGTFIMKFAPGADPTITSTKDTLTLPEDPFSQHLVANADGTKFEPQPGQLVVFQPSHAVSVGQFVTFDGLDPLDPVLKVGGGNITISTHRVLELLDQNRYVVEIAPDDVPASTPGGGSNVAVDAPVSSVSVRGLRGTLTLDIAGKYSYDRDDGSDLLVDNFDVQLRDVVNNRMVTQRLELKADGSGNVDLHIATSQAALNISALSPSSGVGAIGYDMLAATTDEVGATGKFGSITVNKAFGTYTYQLNKGDLDLDALAHRVNGERETTQDVFKYTLADGNTDDIHAGTKTSETDLDITVKGANDAPVVGNRFYASANGTVTLSDVRRGDPDGGAIFVRLIVGQPVVDTAGNDLGKITGIDAGTGTITLTNPVSAGTGLVFWSQNVIAFNSWFDSGTATGKSKTIEETFAIQATEDTPVQLDNKVFTDGDVDDSGGNLTYYITDAPDRGAIVVADSLAEARVNAAVDKFTQAQVDSGLVWFRPEANENNWSVTGAQNPSADVFKFQLKDSGNDGVTFRTETIKVYVEPVNDAPINTVPGEQTPNEETNKNKLLTLEFSTSKGNAISVFDVDDQEFGTPGDDATADTLFVTLTLSNSQYPLKTGTLTLDTTSGLTTVLGDGTSLVSFQGSQSEVNAALNGLKWTAPVANFNAGNGGVVTMEILTKDLGNSGAGGELVDKDTVTIRVLDQNTAPENTVPGLQKVDEDTTLVFSAANKNFISVEDEDAGPGDDVMLITLSANKGTLTLGGTVGLVFDTGDGSGDALMSFKGSLAEVNKALEGLSYTGNKDFNGNDTLTITTNDQGNSGGGGAKQDQDTITIEVKPINDAPVNTVPLALQTVDEDTKLDFAETLKIADVDAAEGSDANPMFVTLTVKNGTLALGSTTGLNSLAGNNTSEVSFKGTVAEVNNALKNLSYKGDLNYNGTDTLTIVTSDQGNTGDPVVVLTDTDTVDIKITAVNDAPVNTVPAAKTIDEDTSLKFVGELKVSDIEADLAGDDALLVTLTVTNGTLKLGTDAGLGSLSGDGTGTINFKGTATEINTALDGLLYTPNSNFNGTDTLKIVTSDQGNSGETLVVLTDTDTVDIKVNAINDTPEITAPLTGTVDEDTALVFNGTLKVDDLDAGTSGDPLLVTLKVSNGTLKLGTDAGLGSPSGDGTSTVSFKGTAAEINAALDGLTYTGSKDFNGEDTLTITTNDQGNTGSPGALADSKSVKITVNAINDAPLITSPTEQTVGIETAFDFKNTIKVEDPDAGTVGDPVIVSMKVGNGTLSLASTLGLTFDTGDGDADKEIVFRGTVDEINTALNGLTYTGDSTFLGADSLVITTDDGGNTGAPGALTDSQSVKITVAEFNEAPVNTVPGDKTVKEDEVLDFGASIKVADADATGDDALAVTLSVTKGTLNLGGTAGLGALSGDGTALITFNGTAAEVNAALNGLKYTGNKDFNGEDTLTITTDDQGNTGFGGSKTDQDTVKITVEPVNDAPVNTLPATYSVADDAFRALAGVSADDPENGNIKVALSLDDPGSRLKVTSAGGASVAGNDSATLTISGTEAAVNATLASLLFREDNAGTTVKLTMTTTDDGALTDIDESKITVTANPIALDLDGNGVDFQPLNDSTLAVLDFTGDGVADRMPGLNGKDAYLIYDQDKSGDVNHRSELVMTDHAPEAKTDLEALLLAFDTNVDGVFDHNDEHWGDFGVWGDHDGDGIAAANEVVSLDEIGITAILLESDGVASNPVEGVYSHGTGEFVWADGSKGSFADVSLEILPGLSDLPSDELLQGSSLDFENGLDVSLVAADPSALPPPVDAAAPAPAEAIIAAVSAPAEPGSYLDSPPPAVVEAASPVEPIPAHADAPPAVV